MHNVLHAQIHYLGSFYRGELHLQQIHEHALLGEAGGSLGWPSRHLAQYFRKKGIGATVGRLMGLH